MAIFLSFPVEDPDSVNMRAAYAAIQNEITAEERAGREAPKYNQDVVARRGTDFMLTRNDLFHLLLPLGPTYVALYLALFCGHPDQHVRTIEFLAKQISAKSDAVSKHLKVMIEVGLIRRTEAGDFARGDWHLERQARAAEHKAHGTKTDYQQPFDPAAEPAWMCVHDAVRAHPDAAGYFAAQAKLQDAKAERMQNLMRLDHSWKQFTELSIKQLLIGMRQRQDLAVVLTICLVGPKCTLSRPMLSLLSGASKNILLPCIRRLVTAGIVKENENELAPTAWMISGNLSSVEHLVTSNIATIKCSRALAVEYAKTDADKRQQEQGVSAPEFTRVCSAIHKISQKVQPLARRLSEDQRATLLKEVQDMLAVITNPLDPMLPARREIRAQDHPDKLDISDAMLDSDLTDLASKKSRKNFMAYKKEKKEALEHGVSVTRYRELKAEGKVGITTFSSR